MKIGPLGLSLLRALVARAGATLGSIILGIVLGRLYGPAGLGVFVLAQSFVLGANMLANRGLNQALVKFVGVRHDEPEALGYLLYALRASILVSSALTLIIFLTRHRLEQSFRVAGLADLLGALCWCIPAFTAAFVASGFFKGTRRAALGVLLENGAISLLAAGILITLHHFTPSQGAVNAGWAMSISAWGLLPLVAIGLVRWRGSFATPNSIWGPALSRDARVEFQATSRSFFVMGLSGFVHSVLGVLIAGALLTPADLGLFKAAERTALLISFLLMVINAVLPTRFARLFHEGRVRELERMAQLGVALGLTLALPVYLIILFFAERVMLAFGAEFGDAGTLLRIVATGQLVNVATGSVSFLLGMTQHDRLIRNIALFSSIFGLALYAILIPAFGVIGAACATAGAVVTQNLLALHFVRTRLGIHTFGLAWLRQRTRIN